MKTYTVDHLFQLLLGLSLTLFLSLIFPIAQIKAENISTLAVVKVPCPKLEVTRLLVADNEPKDVLFLYPVSSRQLDSTRQSQLILEKKIKVSDLEAITKLADQSLADKDTCEQANAFNTDNTEGAVTIPDSLSLEKKFKIWLGLRSLLAMQNTNLPITIDSKLIWNDTGINLVAGQEYHFQATGQWTDWTITSNADGYESPNFLLKLSEGLRRMPNSPWFSLIGSIDKAQDSFFLIGTNKQFIAPKTGRLYCFANDVIIAYGNNRDSIQLTVTSLT